MNEQAIFLAALDITDPAQRADYLNRTCAGDPTLRRQVEALLAAHERSGEFLDVPALQQMAAGASEDWNSLAKTSAEHHDAKGEIDLSFLQPTTKPGSLGRLGHYEVQEVIGRGGCGIVLKAFDEMLQRAVAIKVMAPELASTSPARKRFLREARAAAAIRHENVVSIHSVEDQPIPFLVMEYIAGQTLQQKLDQTGPLDVLEVVQIGHQIASGLEAAHAMGLIHRDIKPGNVLLEKGRDRVKITDFGLARATDDASLTQSGVIAGTPLYMSPEQAMGDEIDQRSDLFSLGSVLYVMCSGRPPFRAATTLAVLKRVAEDQPRPIQEIIPEVPEWLRAFIAKLHAKNPDDRFASAQEVAGLLARCLSELQQHGNVESLAHVLPIIPKPASATKEPAQRERPKSEERPALALDSRPPLPRSRRWVVAAAMLMVLLAGLGLTEATGVTNVRGTVIRLFSPDGTLVVEVDDPGVSVSIDGEEMVITGTGAKEIRLKPGQYKVLASKDGKLVRQELVTVTRNGRQMLRVSKEVDPGMATGVGPSIGGAIAPKMAKFVRGNWHIMGDVIEHPEKSQSALLLFGTPEFGDGDFSCEAMRAEGDHGLALVARASDLENYYYFDIGVFNNSYHSIYAKESGANWRRLDQQKAPPVPTDRWVKMRLRLRGDSFEGYLDDQLVVSGRDDRRLTGYLGLRTWNEAGKYRNLKFTDPTGKVLWQGLPDISTLKPDVSLSARFTNSLGMEFALVPKGKSWLGGGGGKVGDKEVEFKDDFYLGVYEVTQEEWENVTGLTPSQFSRTGAGKNVVKDIPEAELKRFPVDSVSWDDAQLFLERLNKREKEAGWMYRLPTEAEWEYACRGGPLSDKLDSAFDFYFDKPTLTLLPEHANFALEQGKGSREPRKVGSYKPNRLGLYDMHGNVFEWCNDAKGADVASPRVHRGGGWQGGSGFCPAASSAAKSPSYRDHNLGLRVARVRVDTSDPDRRAAEWVLSIGGSISIKENDQERQLGAAADLPKGPFELTVVNLISNSKVSDAGLAHFKDCKNLTSLDLAATKVSDAGLVHFKDCKNLERLVLRHAPVSAAGLVHFADCKNLTFLDLDDTKVSAAGLAHFKDCKNLTHLSLHTTLVRDAWLVHFKDCKDLTYLSLGNAGYVGDAGLAHFKDCKNLTGLVLHGTQVSDAGLAHFMDCKNLTYLDLAATKVSDAGLVHFKDCKNLTYLDLAATKVSDAGLVHFKDCKNLTRLNLASTQVSDAGLAYFKDRKNLTLLGLDRTQVSDVGLAHFADCKNLFDLRLRETQVTDAGLDYFKDCKNLPILVLSGTNVTEAGVKKLSAALPGCKIEWDGGVIEPTVSPDRRAAEWVLSIGGRVRLTDQAIYLNTASELPSEPFRLTWVNLSWNAKMTDAGLAQLKGCEHLVHLELGGAKISDAGMRQFPAFKNLTYLSFHKAPIGDPELAYIKDYKNLKGLFLAETNVSDEGLNHLNGLTSLTSINLTKTLVTAAGAKQLSAALPKCNIFSDHGSFGPTGDPDRRAAEWVLSIGGKAGVNDQDRNSAGIAELPKEPFRLTSVGFQQNEQMTDAGLAHFQGCKNLTSLHLGGTQLTDAGLAHFQGCKDLIYLTLGYTAVTDAGLVYFKDCKNLAYLNVGSTQLTDTGLAHFQDCKNLTQLHLYSTRTTDAGLMNFKDFKNLTFLNLDGSTAVSDAGLAHLAGCPKLSFLNVKKTKVTEAGVKKFSAALPVCKIEWDGGVVGPEGAAPPPGGQAGTRPNDYDKLATGRWIPVLAGPGKSIEPRNAVFSNGLIEISVKQHFEAAADVKEGEFFELAFAAVGDTLTVYANGKRVGEIHDSSIARPGGVAVHTTKGKGVFKDVEVMVLDKPAP